jgi:YfiH family protein
MLFDKFNDRLLWGFSDREGGVSPAPYDSLNVALHVGDKPKNVIENRVLLSEKFGFEIKNLIYMDQIHSDNIEIITDAMQNKLPKTDALITNEVNIPLMVMVADCIPILFYDPVKSVTGVAHAGRNGTFLSIAPKTINKMKKNFGCDPKDIYVTMGPSIKSCCYEVGKDLSDIAIESFGKKYVSEREGRYYLDLQRLNLDQLISSGVKSENIEISTICTSCDKNYFSYRRDGVTGRFAGVVMLR